MFPTETRKRVALRRSHENEDMREMRKKRTTKENNRHEGATQVEMKYRLTMTRLAIYKAEEIVLDLRLSANRSQLGDIVSRRKRGRGRGRRSWRGRAAPGIGQLFHPRLGSILIAQILQVGKNV